MSLIIAKKTPDSIFIESDTRILNVNKEKSNPLSGFLKTIIVHPQICISFAGVNYFANKVFQEILESKPASLRIFVNKLLQANKESENRTDFILASMLGGAPNLFKISDGKVEYDRNTFWIGDKKGFEYYQKTYHSLSEQLSIKERFQKAFRSCIDNSDLTTIGDFHISVSTDMNISPTGPVFLYQKKLEVHVTEKQVIKFEDDNWKDIPFGTVEGGSHGLSYLVTLSPNFHGVALHFTHGKFGVLFCPQISFDGISVKNVDGDEFISSIANTYKIPLEGFVLTDCNSIKYVDSRTQIKP